MRVFLYRDFCRLLAAYLFVKDIMITEFFHYVFFFYLSINFD